MSSLEDNKMATASSKPTPPKNASNVSIKHIQLDKSQSTMLAVIAGTVVLVIFFLFGTKAMISKGLYQRRVINARNQVVDQLKTNYDNAQKLVNQYQVFASQDPNMLGGSATGNGNLDGDNAQLTLDALPSTYDAPALATSLEKIMTGRNVMIDSISVTDDPTTNSDQPEASPQVKQITFNFSGTTDFNTAAQLLQDFERSIRPFDLNTLNISGTDNALKLTVGMTTDFQPAKSLDLTPTKVVK